MCEVCGAKTSYYCFGCKVSLCDKRVPSDAKVKQNYKDDAKYFKINGGNDKEIMLLNSCWLRYHSEGIDRFMSSKKKSK